MAVVRKQRLVVVWRGLVALLFILVLFFLGRGVFHIYQKNTIAALEEQDAERRLSDLAKRQAFLEEATARLSTSEGIEQELRSQFNIKRDGEEVAVIVSDKSATETKPVLPSFWSNPWGWLVKVFVR